MLKETLVRQINQIFRTLKQSLMNAPKTEFDLPTKKWDASIGGIAMHIASSIDSTFPSEELAKKWPSPVSSKEDCIQYLLDCKTRVMIPYIEKEELLEADEAKMYFISRLDRVLKITRHISQHTGEIIRMLKSMGLEGGNFM